MFGPVGNRPHTEQHVALGADRDGTLTAIAHDVISHDLALEDWDETSALADAHALRVPQRSDDAPAGQAQHRHADVQARAGRGERHFRARDRRWTSWRTRSKIDPLELRLRNYAEQGASRAASRSRASRCASAIAMRRTLRLVSAARAAPRSMRDGRWLVGWGMATATYPANRSARAALVRAACPTARALVPSGTQDLGTGTYTVMTQVAADALGAAGRPGALRARRLALPEGAGRPAARCRRRASRRRCRPAARRCATS